MSALEVLVLVLAVILAATMLAALLIALVDLWKAPPSHYVESWVPEPDDPRWTAPSRRERLYEAFRRGRGDGWAGPL